MIAVRERNPQRSKERILSAALTEFAAHGFAGARVEAIARRAGLNKQLISHHFGGKLGLYRAVMNRRRNTGGDEVIADLGPMPGALGELNALASGDAEWIRVLLWETLDRDDLAGPHPDDDPTDVAAGLDERVTRYRKRVEWIADEQAAGRLPAELDPELLLLSLMGAAIYPLLLPNVAELVTGEDPRSEQFAARYRQHLQAFASHLTR